MPRLDYSFRAPHDVCRFARWQYPYCGDNPPGMHTHAFHEIFWIEEGEGLHVINGECRRLVPGTLFLIRPEDVHGFSASREGGVVRFGNFAFADELWHDLRKRRFPAAPEWFGHADHHLREFELDAAQVERLRTLAHDLEAGARDILTAESFLTGALSLLANARRHRQTLPDWLERACKRIAEPAHFLGGTTEFARLAGRSPEHVARELKRRLDKTPTDIVNEARLTYAANQLCSTSREIVDIAADCGLENLGHFYKLFRKRFGITPNRYRRYAHTALEVRIADGRDNKDPSPLHVPPPALRWDNEIRRRRTPARGGKSVSDRR